jgi:serine/threonine protein kinase
MSLPQCPKCGTAVPPGAVVCATCGTGVQAIAPALAATSAMAPTDTPTVHTPPPSGSAATSGSTGSMLTQSRMMEALRSATLGDYEILAELGRGGMATVYLAHDMALDRKVAIKVMSPALLDGEGAIERFKREAKTAGALSHPHIIPIHAVKQSGELLYFVMKYVEGRPLDDVLKSQGAVPIPMVVQILTEVAGALAYAHRKGVIHRDVKPANIMLDDEGWAVVTDFGIAKVTEKKGLTLTGSTVGTPAYMSPEQCAAKDVTGRSDQYSLGIVGYELLTGNVPFSADSLMGMFLAQLNETPPPLSQVRPDCPPLLQKVIERMMAKVPEERWASLEDVVQALAPLQKPKARDSTRVSMASLAKLTGDKPKPDDFSRPLSPTPLNARRSDTAPEVRSGRGVPRWAWAAGAVPILGIVLWLATKSDAGGRAASTPPVTQDSTPPATAASIQSPGPVTPAPTAGTPDTPPADSKGAAVRDAGSGAGSKRPAVNQVAATPQTTGTPEPRAATRTDTGRTLANTPANPAAPPTASPAGTTRTDSAVTSPPDPNAGAPTFTEISAGGSTTCGALANDAGVICWGAASPTGAKLEGLLFSRISVGDGHICALTPSGEAYCWGTNSQGQLGDGSTTERATLHRNKRRRESHLCAQHRWRRLLLGRQQVRPAWRRLAQQPQSTRARALDRRQSGIPVARRRRCAHVRDHAREQGILLGRWLLGPGRQRDAGFCPGALRGEDGSLVPHGRRRRPPHVRHDDVGPRLLLG